MIYLIVIFTSWAVIGTIIFKKDHRLRNLSSGLNIIIYFLRLIAAVVMFFLLFGSFFEHSLLMRVYVFIVSILSASLYIRFNSSKFLAFIMTLIAIIYNPFYRFNFDNLIWLYITIISSGYFIGTIVLPHNKGKLSKIDPGVHYINSLSLKKAEDYYTKILQKKPESIPALNNMGVIHFLSSNFIEAIKYFRLAINLEPSRCLSYYNLALAYDYIGNNELSIDSYKKGVKLNTDFASGYYSYSLTLDDNELSYFPLTITSEIKVIQDYPIFIEKSKKPELKTFVLNEKTSGLTVKDLLQKDKLNDS